jgi:hypothetical protein
MTSVLFCRPPNVPKISTVNRAGLPSLMYRTLFPCSGQMGGGVGLAQTIPQVQAVRGRGTFGIKLQPSRPGRGIARGGMRQPRTLCGRSNPR